MRKLCAIAGLVLCISCSRAFTISGTVSSRLQGKDGYTATIITDDSLRYDAIISRIHLGSAYHDLAVGEKVKVSGDTMHLDGRIVIKATKIH